MLDPQLGMGIRGSKRHFQTVIRQYLDGTAIVVDFHCRVDGQRRSGRSQFLNTSLLNQPDKRQRAAITYRGFRRRHFHLAVVHSQHIERRQQVFHGKYFGYAIFQGRGPHGRSHLSRIGLNRRLAGQIRPKEDNAGIRRGRF